MSFQNIPLPTQIKDSITHNIIDSTKINAFQTCPRAFFYEYILGWRPEGENIHLVFGSAWHEAMETLLIKGGYKEQLLDLAMEAFSKVFHEVYDPFDDLHLAPKDTTNAKRALTEYLDRYYGKEEYKKVLYTEVPGTVSISDKHHIHFKIDTIIENMAGMKEIWDHKTTGADTQAFREQWHLSFQMSNYSHCIYSLYGEKEYGGVVVNGTILRKKGNDFVRIPVFHSPTYLQEWLWTAQHLFNILEWNHEALSECKEEEDVMQAFPKRTTSCFKYGRMCPYADFCSNWSNPLQSCGEPPIGFMEEHWNPRASVENSSVIVEDGKMKEIKKEKEDAGE